MRASNNKLRVHGKVHNPEAVLAVEVGEGAELLTIATSKMSVGTKKSPAAVGLRLDLEGLILALALAVGGKLAVRLAREVLAPWPTEYVYETICVIA